MQPSPTPTARPSDSRAGRGGLAVTLGLIATAVLAPVLTGWTVYSRLDPTTPGSIDPIVAILDPQWIGPGTVPALLVAVIGVLHGPRWAETVRWRTLLTGATAASLAWLVSLATIRGGSGIGDVLARRSEYLPTARAMDVTVALDTWISRIPLGAEDNWPVHVAGHPPLATLFFVGLDRIGLGSGAAAGLAVCLVASTTTAAVLVTLRRLGTEEHARTAAPFLVLTPAALWMAVSADAAFAALATWGLAALAVAGTTTGRCRVAAASAAGLLLGAAVMCSYGLPLLGVMALAVLVLARSWRPLPIAVLAALVPVAVFAVAGFSWWEAFPVLRERYWDGLASRRPAAYWTWANLASLAIACGPWVGAGLAVLAARRREASRVVLVLVGAAVTSVLLADLSQMSRAEVERIWLPWMPWLTLAVVVLPPRWRRPALVGQVVWALALETLLRTAW
ncbi:hypothetical protein [Nocardioides sp.]|uniref:hypothetical protein n=1 Tax=Nocardioides sp. TaxID=35761 RepID=UPI0035190DBD